MPWWKLGKGLTVAFGQTRPHIVPGLPSSPHRPLPGHVCSWCTKIFLDPQAGASLWVVPSKCQNAKQLSQHQSIKRESGPGQSQWPRIRNLDLSSSHPDTSSWIWLHFRIAFLFCQHSTFQRLCLKVRLGMCILNQPLRLLMSEEITIWANEESKLCILMNWRRWQNFNTN